MRCILILVNFGKDENWMKFTSARGELSGGEIGYFKCHLLSVYYSASWASSLTWAELAHFYDRTCERPKSGQIAPGVYGVKTEK